LKPCDEERLHEALRRARSRLRPGQNSDLSSKLEALLAGLKPETELAGRITVKADGKVILLRLTEIDWVESADNYVVLHSGKERHMQRGTLGAMEEKLPPASFVRISRSAIVNVDRIKELQPLFHGEYAVVLRDGTRLTLTRTYRDGLGRLGLS
jgi:two-component system LytT family response regulator